jgi:hypothetical protein
MARVWQEAGLALRRTGRTTVEMSSSTLSQAGSCLFVVYFGRLPGFNEEFLH